MDSPDSNLYHTRILAEILRLQRWAGGESVTADRIFGLMHGFESVIGREAGGFGISEETQRKVEDLLEDVENGQQPADGLSIKDRLHREKIDDISAENVMLLCRLQSRFIEGIEEIAQGQGCVFPRLHRPRQPEQDWFGALHYIELVDCTEGVHQKLHAVFAPAVPRVGEFVTPQNGSRMRVIAVEHVAITQGHSEGVSQPSLVPHVLLEVIDENGEQYGLQR